MTIQVPKGIFCHKVTQNLELFIKENAPKLKGLSVIDVLKYTQIPSKKWFYNDLKNPNLFQNKIIKKSKSNIPIYLICLLIII